MSTSVFVSHVYEDKRWIAQLQDWKQRGQFGPDIVFTTETGDVRQYGEAAIKSHLQPYLSGASVVLVLVGQDAHNHDWVRYEADVALSLRKKVVLARLPNTTGAPPQSVAGLPIAAWEPSALRVALGG
jgi:hypothetical protein